MPAAIVEAALGARQRTLSVSRKGVPPARAGGPESRTLLIRVVAHRSLQVRPARGAWDDHNSDNEGRNLGTLSVRKMKALSNTAGDLVAARTPKRCAPGFA